MFGLSTRKLGLIGALLAGLGMMGAGLYGMSKGRASERQAWEAIVAKMHAAHATAALNASEQYRALEETMRLRAAGAEHALANERTRNASALATQRRDSDELRDQLAAYAAGGSEAPNPACTADRERAQTLGRLLADSVRVQESLAGDGESCESDKRALLSAWPTESKPK